jgi:predicted nucleic acid-binding protein
VIVVDTSVWISALREPTGSNTEILSSLLSADEVALPVPVRVELLSGAGRRERPRLRRALTGLPILTITEDTWSTIDAWIDNTIEAFSIPDLLVAAAAREIGALVWSLDSDFERMERAGLVQLYQ